MSYDENRISDLIDGGLEQLKQRDQNTMNDLHTIILNEARDEVAKEKGFKNWPEFADTISHPVSAIIRMEQASLIALQRQSEFYRWASIEGWSYVPWDKNNAWVSSDPSLPKRTTETELYQQFCTEIKELKKEGE